MLISLRGENTNRWPDCQFSGDDYHLRVREDGWKLTLSVATEMWEQFRGVCWNETENDWHVELPFIVQDEEGDSSEEKKWLRARKRKPQFLSGRDFIFPILDMEEYLDEFESRDFREDEQDLEFERTLIEELTSLYLPGIDFQYYDGQFCMSFPLYDNDLRRLLKIDDLIIMPSDGDEDFVSFEGESIAFLEKWEDDNEQITSLDALKGFANSTAYQAVITPFPPAHSSLSTARILEILGESIHPDEEGWINSEFQDEYFGIGSNTMEIFLGMTYEVLTRLLGREPEEDDIYQVFEGEDENCLQMVDNEQGRLFNLLLLAIVSGSRIMRASLAEQGFNTSLDLKLSFKALQYFVASFNAQSVFLLLMHRNFTGYHLQSLPFAQAIAVENYLAQFIADEWAGGKVNQELLLAWLCRLVEFGLRYQHIRINREYHRDPLHKLPLSNVPGLREDEENFLAGEDFAPEQD